MPRTKKPLPGLFRFQPQSIAAAVENGSLRSKRPLVGFRPNKIVWLRQRFLPVEAAQK
jgi:hypothetical protein